MSKKSKFQLFSLVKKTSNAYNIVLVYKNKSLHITAQLTIYNAGVGLIVLGFTIVGFTKGNGGALTP